MFKGDFIKNLPKIYGTYTGGFAVFIILMAIAEQAGVSAKNIGVMFVAFTVLIYALIGYLSRTIQVDAYYVAGRQVPTVFNGMATAADWMSGASFVALAGGVYFGGYTYMAFLVGWTGGYVLVATLMAPFMTPILMKYLAGSFVPIDFISMMISIVKIVILPIALGLIFNHFFHGKAKWLDKTMPIISMGGIALIIMIITAAGRDDLLTIGILLIIAAIIHNLMGYLLGYWGCRFLNIFVFHLYPFVLSPRLANIILLGNGRSTKVQKRANALRALYCVPVGRTGSLRHAPLPRLRQPPSWSGSGSGLRLGVGLGVGVGVGSRVAYTSVRADSMKSR